LDYSLFLYFFCFSTVQNMLQGDTLRHLQTVDVGLD